MKLVRTSREPLCEESPRRNPPELVCSVAWLGDTPFTPSRMSISPAIEKENTTHHTPGTAREERGGKGRKVSASALVLSEAQSSALRPQKQKRAPGPKAPPVPVRLRSEQRAARSEKGEERLGTDLHSASWRLLPRRRARCCSARGTGGTTRHDGRVTRGASDDMRVTTHGTRGKRQDARYEQEGTRRKTQGRRGEKQGTRRKTHRGRGKGQEARSDEKRRKERREDTPAAHWHMTDVPPASGAEGEEDASGSGPGMVHLDRYAKHAKFAEHARYTKHAEHIQKT